MDDLASPRTPGRSQANASLMKALALSPSTFDVPGSLAVVVISGLNSDTRLLQGADAEVRPRRIGAPPGELTLTRTEAAL